MKTLVIIVHPDMNHSRVNRLWMDSLIKEEIDIIDLYALYPESKINVANEQERLLNYDKIIFQFPFYWYSSPPLLKQYLDEVFLYNYAYGPEGTKLKGKSFGIGVTVGSNEVDYSENGSNHFTLDALLSPFEATFNYIGANYVGYFALYGTAYELTDDALMESSTAYINFVK
ncbi:NAD(P)H-dependent oxidoreductase [Macrococcus equi]|uniref:NAD(P)H-dependent oxidoreductase n=1 Tax=Macrococcus equi TaxID=3395462 RepID=UPI0039BE76CA